MNGFIGMAVISIWDMSGNKVIQGMALYAPYLTLIRGHTLFTTFDSDCGPRLPLPVSSRQVVTRVQ